LIEKGYSYIEGSTARKLDYDVYEDNKVLKAKRQYKDNMKSKACFILALTVVLAAALIVMFRFAMITQIGYNISSSEKAYDDMKNKNALLRLQIGKETDLDKIRQVAETRLGMQNPDKSQMVYISVPRNDHTVVMDTDNDNADTNYAMVMEFLKDSAAGVGTLLTR
jgi:cell division protein FtsL